MGALIRGFDGTRFCTPLRFLLIHPWDPSVTFMKHSCPSRAPKRIPHQFTSILYSTLRIFAELGFETPLYSRQRNNAKHVLYVPPSCASPTTRQSCCFCSILARDRLYAKQRPRDELRLQTEQAGTSTPGVPRKALQCTPPKERTFETIPFHHGATGDQHMIVFCRTNTYNGKAPALHDSTQNATLAEVRLPLSTS